MNLRRPNGPRPLPPDQWYPAASPDATARVLELGEGDAVRIVEAGPSDGTPVVLLHGWGASAYSYRLMLPLLAASGLRGIAPDLRGHGLSAKPFEPGRYSADAMTRQVLAICDALGLTSAVMVGQSMGGAIALDVAATAPERVRAVVLAAPIGLTAVHRITVARALRVSRWIPGWVPRWGVTLLMRRVYGTRRQFEERDVDEYWAAAQFAEWPRALFLLVNAFDWNRRPPEGFRALGSRLRFVLGEHDKLVTLPRALARARSFRAAHVTVVPGAGHLVAEEAPEHVVQAIRDALFTSPLPQPAAP